MKTHKLLIPIIALAVVGSSCKKDSNPALSSAQAEQAISDVNSNLVNDLGDLQATKGGAAITSFTTLTSTANPFGRISSFNKPSGIKEAMAASLSSVRLMLSRGTGGEKTQGSTEAFNFDAKVGIYAYDFGQKIFVKSQETSTIIKIQYPKDANSVTNDAELQITKYTDVSTADGFQPTGVNAAIYISNNKEAALDLTAEYDLSTGQPVYENIALTVGDFSFTLVADNRPATTASETLSLARGGTVLIGTGVDVAWASASDKTNGNPPKTLAGYFQLKTLRFSVAYDGSKAATSKDPNDFLVITVTSNGTLAGHVVWGLDPNNPNSGDQPYMQYNDGNKVLLSTVFANLQTQIKALIPG